MSRTCSLSEFELDGEYSRWREALIEQVEQEIEEQVRLRLRRVRGSRQQRRRPRSTASEQLNLQQLQRRRSSASPVHTHPTTKSTDSVLVRLGQERDTDELGEGQARASGSKLPLSSTQKTCPSRSSPQEVLKRAAHSHSKLASSHMHRQPTSSYLDSKETDLLMHYVSCKYGTPVDQLQRLSATGTFNTISIDSSSCGRGPFIHCPPEADICLPTPNHLLNLSSPVVFPLNSTDTPVQSYYVHRTEREDGDRAVSSSSHSSADAEFTPELKFESRFEGGNLQKAVKIGLQEYHLILRSDLYSNRHTQWFYFRVEGMQSGALYTFHIINLRKPDSLYNYGMQPLLYSEKEAELGWRRVGHHISYHSTSKCQYEHLLEGEGTFFTLSWTMEFPVSEDRCYIAHCFPYPYSKLLSFVEQLQICPQSSANVQCEELCKSLAGNTCPLITITEFQDLSTLSSRAGIVVSARVHPGESNSSWMMEGLMEWLTSDSSHAKVLRNNFVFKLIPMLNPDGVVVGNSRTSLAGVDLNRVYKKPRSDLFPTIYSTKAMLAALKQEREVVMYVDLHGHSRKHNVFTYGCHTSNCDHNQFLNERVFPFLLSRQLPSVFCFKSCKYSVQRCKESTGRVVTWRMGVREAFTLESTFCGCTLGATSWQFSEQDLKDVGRGLGEAIYRRHRMLTSDSYKQRILCELAQELMCSRESSRGCVLDPLPDLVQCARPDSHQQRDWDQSKELKTHAKKTTIKKITKRSAAKTLKEFMKYNLSALAEESSTTGSDSENDEFEYHERKKVRRKRPTRRSLQTSVTLPSLVQHRKSKTTLTQREGAGVGMKEASRYLATRRKPVHSIVTEKEVSGAGNGGAMQASETQRLSQGWRFINRYANRSNGGIPMFSEERLKERAEKQQLQSSRSMTTTLPHTQSPGHLKGHLLWEPVNSNVQRDDSPQVVARQLHVLGCIRDHEKTPVKCKLGSVGGQRTNEFSVMIGGTSGGKVRGQKWEIAKQLSQLKCSAPQELRAQLIEQQKRHQRLQMPSSLAKYICDVWKSNIY